ncbi:DUF2058 family protein [Thermomonas sp. HDW16]|uniref:DUF2058 domain-containing protein n=1 Tax=Thermomonas sp. HDW16 TaxID=2714945 RepID=UPI00140E769E|nr:DUF2058 family protein [Thermomonas sp. HDW16]QIL20703.1 DUF2058 family protein [Thermomonas sp. HDW16]
MINSLKDQLLGLGFSAPKPEPRKPQPSRPGGQGGKPAHVHGAKKSGGKPAQDARKSGNRPAPHKQRSREDIDLAKAYAIRAQKEKDERIEAERLKQEEARLRREAKAKLKDFLVDKSLNAAEADHVRHFEYGGKIKRIHVTAEQLKALNAGELGVVQQDGRYLLVKIDVLAQAEAIFAPAVALKVDPDAPTQDDPYSDPQYQVPDDLAW